MLANVHRLLPQLGQPGMFVTVFYGVVDRRSQRLTFARAGHDRALLLRGANVRSLGGEGAFLGFPGLDDLLLDAFQGTAEQYDDMTMLVRVSNELWIRSECFPSISRTKYALLELPAPGLALEGN